MTSCHTHVTNIRFFTPLKRSVFFVTTKNSDGVNMRINWRIINRKNGKISGAQ